MSTIPSANSTTFWSVQTTFFWSGATYKAVSDITLKYGNKIKEEWTTGTDIPYVGTGGFHGEVDLKGLGSSDNNWWNAVVATSGIVPTMGLEFDSRDTQTSMSGTRWTVSGKATEFTVKASKDNYVEFDAKLILTNRPTVIGITS